MFKFGKRSLDNLATCHPVLQTLAKKALEKNLLDFTVICGHRDKASQDAAFKAGTSGLRWPKSYHNRTPSLAMDLIPFPFISWNDTSSFAAIVELMKDTWDDMAVEEKGGFELICGADWTKLRDMPHFQIVKAVPVN